MPSITRSWTCFHFAAATGADASLHKITNARLSGTPAANRLDNKRVKFSSIRAETLLELPSVSLAERGDFVSLDSAGGGAGSFFGALLPAPLGPLFSASRMGRNPRASMWR